MRSRSALVLLVALVAACDRGPRGSRERQRLLALIDTLPRLEAEERAWPRTASLACDARAEARAREIAALRAQLEEAIAGLPGRPDLSSATRACAEVLACARCDESFAAHCSRAREILVEVQLALAKAELR